MSTAPIGVFDSGLGGLTAVKQLCRILPYEDIIYFGDTARVPYGSRGKETIINYAKQDIAFLLSKNVKTLLAACGTISSTLPKEETNRLKVGYMGVVGTAAKAAAKATKNGRVGIIGTEATIASGSYETAINELDSSIICTVNPCPLFVPLVENGHFGKDDEIAKLAAKMYLKPLVDDEVDTVIMGCTHYPLLEKVLAAVMGKGVELIDPGLEAAKFLKECLAKQNLLAKRQNKGKLSYYVTDDPSRFGHLAKIFLGTDYGGETVKQINIDEYILK